MSYPCASRALLPKTLTLAVLSALAANASAQAADEAKVMQLQNIVVSASGFEQAVQDAPASITVVPREELAKRAYPDATEALKDIPGVVITGGGSSSDISIRGMSASYTMILIDGVRTSSRETRPNSDGPGIEQGWMPPLEAIERIEVIRGPMSSLYGSDAMGGVINIITRKVAREWHGSLRTEGTLQEKGESGDLYSGNFYVSGPLKENLLGLQVSGIQSRRIEDSFVGGFNRQETRGLSTKLSLTPNENHDVTLELGRTLQERIETPGRSMAEKGSKGKYNTKDMSKFKRSLYSLSHNGRYGAASSTSYIAHEAHDNPDRKMFLKNTNANTQWTLPISSHVLTAGASFDHEELKDGENQMATSTIDRLQRYQWALFSEDEWSLTDSFALTGGVRMTHDEHYGVHWTPRVYGVWHATDNFSIKGGVSTGFKAPDLRSSVADWGQVTGGGSIKAVIVGNPLLKPENSVSQEISLNWDNRDDLASSLTLFNTNFKDKISSVYRCQDTAGNGEEVVTGNCVFGGETYAFIQDRINVDRAVVRGVEATLTWQVAQQVRVASNYTFTHSEQKSGVNEGKPLNKMPKHMVNATVDYTPNDDLGLWARWNLRGKTVETSRGGAVKKRASYAFMDLGANYRWDRNLTVGVAVYNVFDKVLTNEDFGSVQDGRRYWANATVTF